MSDQAIQYQVDDQGVATITLSRPEIHNAFDDVVVAALTDAFNRSAVDDSVKVVVLASTGKSFCAGGDLNWMKRMASYTFEENLRDGGNLAAMLKALNLHPKPTIARVQGPAYGGGVGLVSCCDMAIATEQASFCLSEVKVGMIPATISPYVIRAIGARAARRYFTTAEVIDAQRAYKLGLVSELVDADQLDETIAGIVKSLLRNSPRGVTESKRLVIDFSDCEITDELIAETSRRIAETRNSEDGREGLTAFLEKRKPAWIK